MVYEVVASITGGVTRRFQESLRKANSGLDTMEGNMAELSRSQRTAQNAIKRTERQLKVLGDQLAATGGPGSREFDRITRSIVSSGNRLDTYKRTLADVNSEIRELAATSKRAGEGLARLGRNVGLGGIAATGGLVGLGTGAARGTFEDFRRIRQVLVDFPYLGFAEGRAFNRLVDRLGLPDEGQLADVGTEGILRLGKFRAGASQEFQHFIDHPAIRLGEITNITDPIEYLIASFRQLERAWDEGFHQDVAGASEILYSETGGRLVLNLLRFRGDLEEIISFYEKIGTEQDIGIISEKNIQRLDDFRESMVRTRQSIDDLRDVTTLALAPAIEYAAHWIEQATDATALWIEQNRQAVPWLGAAAAGVAGLGFGLAQISEPLGNFGLTILGLKALNIGGIVKSLGIGAVFLGKWSLIIGAIAVAAGALAAAIVIPIEKIGGLQHAWEIALTSAKAAWMTFVEVVAHGVRPIAVTIDTIIEGLNWIRQMAARVGIGNRAAIGLGPQIDWRATPGIDRLIGGAQRSRTEAGAAIDRGRATGWRLDYTGQSLASRIGRGDYGSIAREFGIGVSSPNVGAIASNIPRAQGGAPQFPGARNNYPPAQTGPITINNTWNIDQLGVENVQELQAAIEKSTADGIRRAFN